MYDGMCMCTERASCVHGMCMCAWCVRGVCAWCVHGVCMACMVHRIASRAGAGTSATSTGITTTMRTTHCATCAPTTPSRGRIGRWSATRMAGALRAHARALTETKPKLKSESGSGPDLTPTLEPYSLAGASRLLAIHHYNMRHAKHSLLPSTATHRCVSDTDTYASQYRA